MSANPSEPHRAEKIVETLRSIHDRKQMYVGSPCVENMESFLAGFFTACMACGVQISWADWNCVAAERGWSTEGGGAVFDMRRRGLSDARIIDELFSIHLDTMERATQ